MKIKLISIGKTDESYLKDGMEKYQKRLKHYINFEYIELPEIKNAGNLPLNKLKEEEGNLILSKGKPEYIILLDENGKEFSSVEFSNHIQKK